MRERSLTSTPTRILVTRLKSIGDILFTLPAVHLLRENFPEAEITFLTSKEFGPLLRGFADVDEIVTIDRSRFRRGNVKHMFGEISSLLRLFRQKKFSLAIDLHGHGETAFLTWLTRAPQRWGIGLHTLRGCAYTRRAKRDRSLHPAEANLALLRQCGLSAAADHNEFVMPEPEFSEARKLFAQLGLDAARPALFIQPFTSSPRKNWPLENYLAVARHWRDAGVQILFGGGPDERTRLEPAIRAGFPVSAGAPLLVSAGLAKLCTAIVGGDTGLMHMAVALRKRAVFLAPSASGPGKFYPFRHPEWRIVPPAGTEISAITVETVIAACNHAFAEAADERMASHGRTLASATGR